MAEKIDLPDDEAQAAEISLRIANELRQRRGQSYRALCRELGLPERNHGLLSKAARGLPISAASERTIGRALGVIPPARRVPRIAVSEAQRQRRQAGGWAWADIIEAGLLAMEGESDEHSV